MKYIIPIVLVFTSTYCFAIDQNLIDGAKAYEVAVKNLEEIEINIKVANDSPGYWSEKLAKANSSSFASCGMKKFYRDKIDESDKPLWNLGAQREEAIQMLNKYKPLKEEYSREVEIERKREALKTAMLNIAGMLILPLSIFMLVLSGLIHHYKKYRRLFESGEITQDEYERMMQNSGLSIWDDERRNPATGLIVYGSVDAGGNAYGCSFKNPGAFDDIQDYRDRHRWE